MVRPLGIRVSPYAWMILTVPVVLLGTVFAATAHTSHQSAPGAAQQMGTICEFTAGPRAGATQDYSPMQAPLNAPCKDGSGSTGAIVASAPTGKTTGDQQMGTVCRFTTGPRAGQTQDSSPMQTPVNMSCTDGMGSSGTIVAAADPPAEAADSPQTSATGQTSGTGSVCKFTTGPKAGSLHDFAPMHSPLGTACDDGAGSSGVIVAAQQMGTVCKFTSGPKAGSLRDYAPMHSPLGTECDDGAGSSGAIVAAQQMGTACKFTSGPKSGSTHDYAPMHSPLNTPCDDGSGSNGIIVVAPPMGSICRFTSGPKAGSAHDYAPMRALLNTPCDDGEGSSGAITAAPVSGTSSGASAAAADRPAPTPNAAAKPAATTSSAAAPAPGNAGQSGLGSVCKLTSGPKAGTTYNFAPMQAAIGAPCNYGPENIGTIIAGESSSPAPPRQVASGPPMGSICRFTSGPLALTTADFSPKRALVGTPCTDERGSRGVIVQH